jgi:uncharacterized membrane protein
MDDIAIARALHVLAIIHWIGGVAFVTLIILPLTASRASGKEAVDLFKSIERKFSAQVRVSIPLAGATGFWMTYRMDLWSRFSDPHFWWMDAMLGLWLLFMFVVFVAEPLFQYRPEAKARVKRFVVLRSVFFIHSVLLALAAVTVFGAVAGAHGMMFF